MKPKLLDTFCKAGGAGYGYSLAGFDVVGVDIEPQPNYPFEFHQADAIEFINEYGRGFDIIHSSPVCKGYTSASKVWKSKGYKYPDQIAEVRAALIASGKEYIIENVKNAPLINPVVLNGGMFGLNVHRVRYFETSFPVPFFLLPPMKRPVKMGRRVKDGDVIQPVGHFSNVAYAAKQMGIDWMTQDELSQAIPPAYTQWLGSQVIKRLTPREADLIQAGALCPPSSSYSESDLPA